MYNLTGGLDVYVLLMIFGLLHTHIETHSTVKKERVCLRVCGCSVSFICCFSPVFLLFWENVRTQLDLILQRVRFDSFVSQPDISDGRQFDLYFVFKQAENENINAF